MSQQTTFENWLPASAAPEDDYVLAAVKGYCRPVIAGLMDDGLWWEQDKDYPMAEDGLEVTHFMLLPPMPEGHKGPNDD